MEENRNAPPEIRDDFDLWTWLESLFTCLIGGKCYVAPSIQCGVQGVQSRAIRDNSPNTTEQDRVTGGSYASEAQFPWSVALRLGKTF